MSLELLGWTPQLALAFNDYFQQGLVPARVTLQHRNAYEVLALDGDYRAECTGRLLHYAVTNRELPTVGDWTAIRPRQAELGDPALVDKRADIHAVLPRHGQLTRRAAGERETEQVLAANVDTVFLVTGLDNNFNLRRLERYLTVAYAGKVSPVILLNKADLHPAPQEALAAVESIAPGVPVILLSAREGEGLERLGPWLQPGQTVALLGSSGVGKSTLINKLLGAERQVVRAISEAVNKGRHTTSHRELIRLGTGAMVIDTPGLRELQFWDLDDSSLENSFADIAQLATRCRFHDCSHSNEPGCALRDALETGSLTEERWQAYSKLKREQAYAARRVDPQLARKERDRWKKIHMGLRQRERFERDI